MAVFHNINSLPVFERPVITIGTFDGVHAGHKMVIRQLLEEASRVSGTAIIITFDPHPKQVVDAGAHAVQLLNSPEEKYALLEAQGIHHIVVVPFNGAFAAQRADAYIRDFLVANFHPHTIIIGYDHRFGLNRDGDYKLLEDAGETYHYTVKEIPEHVLQDVTVSSTRVRRALLEGDVAKAAFYLGYDYFFSGIVIHGNELGRTLGYPTANLDVKPADKLVPGNGVYAVDILWKEKTYKGMMNIGVRPTINGIGRVIEVNIFDFKEMIYDETLKITFRARLRDEVKFNGLDQLKAQLQQDEADARKLL